MSLLNARESQRVSLHALGRRAARLLHAGPYGSIFAPASLKRSSHSRISVVGKVERKWSMPVRVLLAFLTRGRMAPDGDLVNAEWLCFEAIEVEGN